MINKWALISIQRYALRVKKLSVTCMFYEKVCNATNISKKCSIAYIFYSLKWAHFLIQITVSYTFCNLDVTYSAFSIWYFLADPLYLVMLFAETPQSFAYHYD